MTELKISGSIGYLFKVLVASLQKMGIEPVAGAIDENNVVVGIPYETMKEELTGNVDKDKWSVKVDKGKLLLKSNGEVVDEPVEKVNSTILSRLRKMGVDARAFLTSDNETFIMIDLENLIYQILQKALNETKTRAGEHMRNLRVKMGTISDYSYILIYRKGRQAGEGRIAEIRREVESV